MKWIKNHIEQLAAALGFVATFAFFLFAYPYHLIRREQFNLFLFDWDYIGQTYRGSGWLARFVADFLEQFFCLPVAGPLIVALLLTGIGIAVFKICRHFLGKWPSLGIAFLFFAWSFMRETGNLYTTRYTVVVLGYLSLILLALQFRKVWLKGVAAAVLLLFGVWALASPWHKSYGKLWSHPKFDYERIIALDAEVARENWDKVLELSRKDLHMVEASYCYNLAHAMKGDLGETLLNHSQSNANDLLLRVDTERSPFTNCLAGEAWFQLGNMTVAEQSAIISLQASPKHTGARFLKRLARVNLISGQDASAQKYLNLLSRTLFYGKWARKMLPGCQDEATRKELAEARSRMAITDFVHHSEVPGTILRGLLEANPSNRMARNYLLCYDLMRFDLEEFMKDYVPDMIPAHLYHEAVLIWLNQEDEMTEENVAKYGVSNETVNRLTRFYRNPDLYRTTYWYYYLDAFFNSE
jgi:hypothetical protein